MTRRPRLLVIDPSAAYPETEGVEQVLLGWPGDSIVLQPALEPGDGPAPKTGYEFDGVVLLGSRASVFDDDPWLKALVQWLRPIVDGSVTMPLLGICFGHQLVGHLAGADVGFLRADRTKRVGIGESRIDGSRLIGESVGLRVIFSHREELKSLPPDYRLVARRPSSALDGLEHERLPIFTFQFHPEARADFVIHSGLDVRELDPRLIRDSRRILDGFQRLVAARSRTSS